MHTTSQKDESCRIPPIADVPRLISVLVTSPLTQFPPIVHSRISGHIMAFIIAEKDKFTGEDGLLFTAAEEFMLTDSILRRFVYHLWRC